MDTWVKVSEDSRPSLTLVQATEHVLLQEGTNYVQVLTVYRTIRITEYLATTVQNLNVLCGWALRAGSKMKIANVYSTLDFFYHRH